MAIQRASTEAVAHIPSEVKVGTEQGVSTNPQLPSTIIEASAEALKEGGLADKLAFLSGRVEVTLGLPASAQDTVMREVIYHKGVHYIFDRGVPQVVPRFILGMLARKKKETVKFSGQRAANGDALNRVDRRPYHRFSHTYRSLETSPEAQARETEWYRKQLQHHF